MQLSREDAAAIAASAQRLGLDPYSFGGLLQLESGMRPDVWGGAGGQYYGLIQFGPGARKEVGLPSGAMGIRDQLPYVEKYFSQRGYKPGGDPADNIKRAYRTVLVGNPHESGTDSFGTNSDRAAARMMPGGDLYKTASSRLGSLDGLPSGFLSGSAPAPEPVSTLEPDKSADDVFAEALADTMFKDYSDRGEKGKTRFAATDTAEGFTDRVEPGRMAGSKIAALSVPDLGKRSNPWMAAAGFDEEPEAPKPEARPDLPQTGEVSPAVSSNTPAAEAVTAASAGDVDIVSVGRRLQEMGFKVAEHPEFGGVGKHSPRSHHYDRAALDLTIQPGSRLLAGMPDSKWLDVTKVYGEKLRKAFPGAEIFHPGDPVDGHDSHIHLGFPGGRGKFTPLAKQYGFVA